MLRDYDSLRDLFLDLIPEYRNNSKRHFLVKFGWDSAIADFLEGVGPRRAANRLATYIMPGELERCAPIAADASGCSIRFGGKPKEGHGFVGERKDFCLVGGTYRAQQLSLFYRRIDLLGGLFYDTLLMRECERQLGRVRSVCIYACQSDVYARKRGSNEKLWHRLREYYGISTRS